MHDILFTVSHETVLLAECSIREGFVNQCCWMSKMLLRAVHAVQPVYYMDTFGTIYKFTDYQGVPDYPGKLTSTS